MRHAPDCRKPHRHLAFRKSQRKAPACVHARDDESRSWRSRHRTGPAPAVVSDNAHGSFRGKAVPNRLQHRWREIDGHSLSIWLPAPRKFLSNQIQQPPVPGTQVQNLPRARGNKFQQRQLPFATMGNRVSPFQVVAGVLIRGPEIDGLCTHEGKVYGNV
jgi:hypothetical protein